METNVSRTGVKKSTVFNYAVGMFGTSIPINLLKTYAAVFYIDTLGLGTRQWAFILGIYTVIDAMDNLFYGWLSDRTRTRIGRRRPWLLISAPLLAIGLILFFNPTEGVKMAAGVLFTYCMILYIFTGTMDSLVNANYGALFPELFPDDRSRVVTNALRQGFQLLAMVISIALTPLVADKLGYGRTALVYGIIGAVVILYMAITAPEKQSHELGEAPKLIPSIMAVVGNRNFWTSGVTIALYSAAMSLVLAAMPFYAKYTLQLESLETTMLFATVLALAMISISFWAILVRKFKLLPIWRIAILCLAVAFSLLAFAQNLTQALICCLFVGAAYGGVLATMDLIGARVVDDDYQKNGIRREGIINNALGFMNRLNGAFTSLGYLLVASIYGFDSGKNPGPRPGDASRFLLAIFPMILMILCLIASFTVKFKDQEYPSQTESSETNE